MREAGASETVSPGFFMLLGPGVENRLVIASGTIIYRASPGCNRNMRRPEESATRYEDRGRTLYFIQDTASAMTNMILAAVNYGLGTCWVGAFSETKERCPFYPRQPAARGNVAYRLSC